MGGTRLTRDFFARDTVTVARELLGRRLVRLDDGRRLSGRIVETEAYAGSEDLGCHGKSGRTVRNRSLWQGPATVYVYFTYGMHWLVNLVTDRPDFPSAVLVRAIDPDEGLEIMRRRRRHRPDRELTNGPAKLCQALAVDQVLDGSDCCARQAVLFVEEAAPVSPDRIVTGARVGLNTVPEPWKSIPWRFRVDPADLRDEAGKGKRT